MLFYLCFACFLAFSTPVFLTSGQETTVKSLILVVKNEWHADTWTSFNMHGSWRGLHRKPGHTGFTDCCLSGYWKAVSSRDILFLRLVSFQAFLVSSASKPPDSGRKQHDFLLGNFKLHLMSGGEENCKPPGQKSYFKTARVPSVKADCVSIAHCWSGNGNWDDKQFKHAFRQC